MLDSMERWWWWWGGAVCVRDPGVQGRPRMCRLWLLLPAPKWCLFKKLITHTVTQTHTNTQRPCDLVRQNASPRASSQQTCRRVSKDTHLPRMSRSPALHPAGLITLLAARDPRERLSRVSGPPPLAGGHRDGSARQFITLTLGREGRLGWGA